MSKPASYLMVGGLLLGLGIDFASPRAAADSEEMLRAAEISFGVYALGAKSLDIGMTLRRDSDSLQIDTAMRTAGMVDFATRFIMNGQALARISDDRYQPVQYVTDSDGRWSKRITRMSWGNDGLPVTEVFPPNDEDDREEVPDALKLNALDPNTAMIARLLRNGAQNGASAGEPPCDGMDAIYDGRRRYNMHFSALGPDSVPPHNRSAYSGPAFKCQMKLEPVAGYTRKYLAEWSEKDEQPTTIWLVQPPGFTAWVPVQLETSTRMGSARAWISAAKLNGRQWLAPLGPIRAELPRDNY